MENSKVKKHQDFLDNMAIAEEYIKKYHENDGMRIKIYFESEWGATHLIFSFQNNSLPTYAYPVEFHQDKKKFAWMMKQTLNFYLKLLNRQPQTEIVKDAVNFW